MTKPDIEDDGFYTVHPRFDIAAHARRAEHMDYTPHPEKTGPEGVFFYVLLALIAVLVSLMIGYAVVSVYWAGVGDW